MRVLYQLDTEKQKAQACLARSYGMNRSELPTALLLKRGGKGKVYQGACPQKGWSGLGLFLTQRKLPVTNRRSLYTCPPFPHLLAPNYLCLLAVSLERAAE